ncbi:MAG: hypothetical protein R2822_23640 [Spirosomataceae bacterium]
MATTTNGQVRSQTQNLNDLKAHRLGWDLLLDEHQAIQVGNEQIGLLGIQN